MCQGSWLVNNLIVDKFRTKYSIPKMVGTWFLDDPDKARSTTLSPLGDHIYFTQEQFTLGWDFRSYLLLIDSYSIWTSLSSSFILTSLDSHGISMLDGLRKLDLTLLGALLVYTIKLSRWFLSSSQSFTLICQKSTRF